MTLDRTRPNDLGAGEMLLEELDSLLGELSQAAASAVPPVEFASQLLRSAVRASRAEGAVLWAPDKNGRWRAEFLLGTRAAGDASHADAVRRAAEAMTPQVVAGTAVDERGSEVTSVLAPTTGRVLELVAGPASIDRDRRLLVEIARSFAEVAGEFFSRRELESLRDRLENARRLDAFTRAVHRSIEIGPTSFAIANDGRAVIECDRLTVIDGRNGRVLAISGVESPDRRSTVVRQIEGLVKNAVAAEGRHWRFRGDHVESDAGQSSARMPANWQDYRSATSATAAELVLLVDEGDSGSRSAAIGAIFAEWFEKTEEPNSERVVAVATHARQALRNSFEATPGPIGRGLKTLAAPFLRRNLPKSVVAAVFVLSAVAALALIPAEFVVRARGRLVPARSREIFAPADGVVQSVAARHGDGVEQGGTLLTLKAPLLDLERERINGELATARERLRGIQAERATRDRGSDGPPVRPGQLAAEEQELSERIASLEKQLEIIDRQIDELTVRSPLNGVVLTWETDERLESRPVRQGQRLLTVAAPEGDWLLEMFVPDRSVGHLLEARNAADGPLPIDYLLATEPQTSHHAMLDQVALSVEPDGDGQPSLRAVARLTRDEVPAPRPGATVVANVRCGRRAIGYVWFHEIYEALLTHVLF